MKINNRRYLSLWAVLTGLMLLISACSNSTETPAAPNVSGLPGSQFTAGEIPAEPAALVAAYDPEDLAADWDESSATKITLQNNTFQIDGGGASAQGSTLTITEAGTYVLSGKLADGQILVKAGKDDLVRLVLNGVEISCADGAAIYAEEADKVILTLAAGAQNSIKDGTAYVFAGGEDEPDAAVFSRIDLSINGTGSLTVDGQFNNGIASKDDLIITGGNITVKAVKDALRGRDSIVVKDGIFTLTSGGDTLQSNNDEDAAKGWILLEGGKFELTAGEDAIQAETALQIDGGEYTISAEDDAIHAETALIINGGTINIARCTEGLEGGSVTVNNGTVRLISTDDGINAANDISGFDYFIRINGGYIYIDAGGDGIDSNGSLYLNGGSVLVNGPTDSGNGAMDYDRDGQITGGTLAFAGSAGMAQGPRDTSTQASLMLYFSSVQKAGTTVTLADEKGTVLLSFIPAKDYQTVLFSSPQLQQGKTYTVSTGGTPSAAGVDGLSTGGTVSGAAKLLEVTLENVITSISEDGAPVSGGFGGMGGRRGGGGLPGGEPPDGFPEGGLPGGERGERPQGGERPQRPDDGGFPANPGQTGGLPSLPEDTPST